MCIRDSVTTGAEIILHAKLLSGGSEIGQVFEVDCVLLAGKHHDRSMLPHSYHIFTNIVHYSKFDLSSIGQETAHDTE